MHRPSCNHNEIGLKSEPLQSFIGNPMKNSTPHKSASALLAALLTLCHPFAAGYGPAQGAGLPIIPEPSVTVYAAGDIADCKNNTTATSSAAARTAALVLAGLQNPSAVALTLGDNAYPDGALSEFTDCYAPTWGQFKARTHPAPGNHEYRTPGAAGYFDYFGAGAGPGKRGYYRVQLGQWQILSLNSYLKAPEQAAQLAWLKAELAAHPSHCTLAYWHHPVFSSGGHGNDTRMTEAWKILQAANIELVLSGHDHHYERFAAQDSDGKADQPHGIREFVVGTGGSHLYPIGTRRDNSEIASNSSFGVLKLVLKEKSYEWEFLPADKGGFTDSGVNACH
jgi:hypothetical protein